MKAKYTGPPQQQCHELAELTGVDALLEPDRVYEMPDEFGERLLASSAHWELLSGPKPLTKPAAKKRLKELGVDAPSNATVAQLRELVAQHDASTANDDESAAAAGGAGEES